MLRKDPEGLAYFHQPESGVSARQHPSDDLFRHKYYSKKYDSEDLSMLIGHVTSRHISDALKNLGRRELEELARAFRMYDTAAEGVITLEEFTQVERSCGGHGTIMQQFV